MNNINIRRDRVPQNRTKAHKGEKGWRGDWVVSKHDEFRAYEWPCSKSSWFWKGVKTLSKWWMFFISSKKVFSFLRYLQFCPDVFGYIGKRLDKKAKVNLKIYDATNWKTKNYIEFIARYLKEWKQLKHFWSYWHIKKNKGANIDPWGITCFKLVLVVGSI